MEWDGTPHRIYGGDLNVERYFTGEFFAGYDNDRTMVRIGWMNMILHGIENPTILLRDSLDKNSDYDKDTGAYDIALANPPFTGSVDKNDLHETRFPRNPRNAKEPITNKSELLFVWVLLDLLRVGGRAAVIVPEGILFGSTGAHKELRRQLLMEHRVEGVISLPAGAFQPYAGVQTSILVFQKVGGELALGEQPRTEQVWFYDVAADGYTLDAKRNDKPEPNDLWDALEKWKTKDIDSIYYYQPELFDERWRLVDDNVVRMFPNLAREKDRLLGIHEMFPELPRDPGEATEAVVSEERQSVQSVFWSFLFKSAPNLMNAPRETRSVRDVIQKTVQPLTRLFNDTTKQMLESGYEDFGRKALSPLVESVREEVLSKVAGERDKSVLDTSEEPNWEALVQRTVQKFARLDGYNLKLRTREVFKEENALTESKSWFAPVRVFVRRDDWTSEDGTTKGSHDEGGNVRPEYLADTELYHGDGTVRAKYLDAGCIEANDFNLSAGRYKPFTVAITDHKPPAEIISTITRD